ncbi:MAG TPA: hypothetical protein VHN36_03140 [Ilumatobacteraceae bacterium]|nr:hypothetical protein [Ilumatobacteraceae bacterium]
MADVRFAPPLQRLTSPPEGAPAPPPPPAAPAPPALRLTPPSVTQIRETTGSSPLISFQDLIQPKVDPRPSKRKKKRGKKLITFIVFVGLLGGAGYYFRNAAPVQRVLHHQKAAAPLPAVPFLRPAITSAEYSITLSAVQNGVPNNVTTKVRADFLGGTAESTVESQVGGVFSTSQEIRTADSIFRPGQAFGTTWTRQPRTPDTPATYDSVDSIPMVDDIIDQPLRDAAEPTSSKSEKVGDSTISTMTYVIDRARVPEIAPAIFARVPWLFDVPNATTLTVEISYDELGVVRHLDFRVDPPQPGTGSDATWVTSYAMDVTSLNAPVAMTVPGDALEVPVGTP